MLINFSSFELAEELCCGQGIVRRSLHFGRSCRSLDLRIKHMKKLESLFMVCGQMVSCAHVGMEFVDTQLKPSKHLLNRLSRLLCEIFIFTPVSLKLPSLDRSCPLMVISEGSLDLTRCLKVLDALILSCDKGREKQIDCLVVPFVLSDLYRLGTSRWDHIGRFLGNLPYVTALAQ